MLTSEPEFIDDHRPCLFLSSAIKSGMVPDTFSSSSDLSASELAAAQ
jgi:hypothetical protein